MKFNIYLYIIIMALITYLIRMLPLTLIRKQIKSKRIRSFLYYVPYVTLSVMTFPAILTSTSSIWSALAGFVTAIIIAYRGGSLIKVSMGSCIAVFLLEFLI